MSEKNEDKRTQIQLSEALKDFQESVLTLTRLATGGRDSTATNQKSQEQSSADTKSSSSSK